MNRQVARRDVSGLSSDATLVDHVRERAPHEPVILQGSRVTGWPALAAWNPEAFRRGVPLLDRVYTRPRASGPRFGPLFDRSRPLGELPTVRWDHPHGVTDLPPAAFFGPSDQLRYHVDRLDRLPLEMTDQVDGSELLADADGQLMVWLGEAGVQAHLHWDTQPNLNAQVVGRKRFLLLPPEAWRVARPYPFLHPSMGQCQLDIFDAPPAGLWEAVLEPGEVLFVPPMWFHGTEALEPCINVNGFGHAHQTDVLAAALHVLDARLGTVDPGAVAAALMEPGLLRDLYRSRYQALVEQGQLPRQPVAVGTPTEDERALAAELRGVLAPLPEASRDTWTGHLVEVLALHATGIEGVAGFLATWR